MIEGHGDDLYKYPCSITANFSSNLCSWVDLSRLEAHLHEKLDKAITTYPEPQPKTLEAVLARNLYITPENVCVTAGVTEAIYLIAQTFAEGKSTVLQPTFSEYADACRIHRHRVISLFYLPEDGCLPKGLQLFWLCNPNNPTGTVTDKAVLKELIQKNPHVCFIIDQSYEAFTLRPLFTAAEAALLPNVLLLHSLTKRFAIPGLRLGFLTGSASLLHQLRTHRMPWSVNGVALIAGLFLAEHPDAVPFDLPACLEETARLSTCLRALGGMDVWDTDTHFMLVHLRIGQAAALKNYLVYRHGILIRDASNFECLDNSFFRIATQRREDNERLLQGIAQWMEE